MQRVQYLVEKLTELSKTQRALTAIDIDLMLDYTRVLYADLLEERKNAGFQNIAPVEQNKPEHKNETEVILEQEITQEQTPTRQPIKDLRTIIGINDKYLYISELFNGDKTAYEQAIKNLSSVSEEEDAIGWIKSELHDTHNWDADDETVKSFYGLVSSSFS